MKFNNILGHEKIKEYLLKSHDTDKLSHAYIFVGKEGIGKMTLAREFAKIIHCEKGVGCGECHGCIRVEKDSHPDYKVIIPDGNSIKNKQIEDFQNQMAIKPYDSSKKLFIIEAAGSMTTSAQNRLLKVFEEPPEYGIVILVTDNLYKLLPTIRSRGQILNFTAIPKFIMEEQLKKRYNIDNTLSDIYYGFSEGSYGRAIKFIEDEEFLARRKYTIDMMDGLLGRDNKIYDYIAYFEDNKDYIEELLSFMMYWLRDIIVYKESGDTQFIVNKDSIDTIQKHGRLYDKKRLYDSIMLIKDTKSKLNSNVNYSLCIETLLLNIQEGR